MHAAFGETARKQLRVVEGIAPADDPVIARRQIEFRSPETGFRSAFTTVLSSTRSPPALSKTTSVTPSIIRENIAGSCRSPE